MSSSPQQHVVMKNRVVLYPPPVNSHDYFGLFEYSSNTPLPETSTISLHDKLRTIVMVDSSGSMASCTLWITTKMMPLLFEKLNYPPEAEIDFIFFGTSTTSITHTVANLKKSKHGSAGITNMGPALERMLGIIKGYPQHVSNVRIIAISDGLVDDLQDTLTHADNLYQYLETTNLIITSHAIRLFTNPNNQPDTRALSCLMSLHNQTASKPTLLTLSSKLPPNVWANKLYPFVANDHSSIVLTRECVCSDDVKKDVGEGNESEENILEENDENDKNEKNDKNDKNEETTSSNNSLYNIKNNIFRLHPWSALSPGITIPSPVVTKDNDGNDIFTYKYPFWVPESAIKGSDCDDDSKNNEKNHNNEKNNEKNHNNDQTPKNGENNNNENNNEHHDNNLPQSSQPSLSSMYIGNIRVPVTITNNSMTLEEYQEGMSQKADWYLTQAKVIKLVDTSFGSEVLKRKVQFLHDLESSLKSEMDAIPMEFIKKKKQDGNNNTDLNNTNNNNTTPNASDALNPTTTTKESSDTIENDGVNARIMEYMTYKARFSRLQNKLKKLDSTLSSRLSLVSNLDNLPQFDAQQTADFLSSTSTVRIAEKPKGGGNNDTKGNTTEITKKPVFSRAIKGLLRRHGSNMDLSSMIKGEVREIALHINELEEKIGEDEFNLHTSFISLASTLDGLRTLASLYTTSPDGDELEIDTVEDNETMLDRLSPFEILSFLNIIGVPINSPAGHYPDPFQYRLNHIFCGHYCSISDIIAQHEFDQQRGSWERYGGPLQRRLGPAGEKLFEFTLKVPGEKNTPITSIIPIFENPYILPFIMKYAPTLLNMYLSIGMRRMMADVGGSLQGLLTAGFIKMVEICSHSPSEVNISVLANIYQSLQTCSGYRFNRVIYDDLFMAYWQWEGENLKSGSSGQKNQNYQDEKKNDQNDQNDQSEENDQKDQKDQNDETILKSNSTNQITDLVQLAADGQLYVGQDNVQNGQGDAVGQSFHINTMNALRKSSSNATLPFTKHSLQQLLMPLITLSSARVNGEYPIELIGMYQGTRKSKKQSQNNANNANNEENNHKGTNQKGTNDENNHIETEMIDNDQSTKVNNNDRVAPYPMIPIDQLEAFLPVLYRSVYHYDVWSSIRHFLVNLCEQDSTSLSPKDDGYDRYRSRDENGIKGNQKGKGIKKTSTILKSQLTFQDQAKLCFELFCGYNRNWIPRLKGNYQEDREFDPALHVGDDDFAWKKDNLNQNDQINQNNVYNVISQTQQLNKQSKKFLKESQELLFTRLQIPFKFRTFLPIFEPLTMALKTTHTGNPSLGTNRFNNETESWGFDDPLMQNDKFVYIHKMKHFALPKPIITTLPILGVALAPFQLTKSSIRSKSSCEMEDNDVEKNVDEDGAIVKDLVLDLAESRRSLYTPKNRQYLEKTFSLLLPDIDLNLDIAIEYQGLNYYSSGGNPMGKTVVTEAIKTAITNLAIHTFYPSIDTSSQSTHTNTSSCDDDIYQKHQLMKPSDLVMENDTNKKLMRNLKTLSLLTSLAYFNTKDRIYTETLIPSPITTSPSQPTLSPYQLQRQRLTQLIQRHGKYHQLTLRAKKKCEELRHNNNNNNNKNVQNTPNAQNNTQTSTVSPSPQQPLKIYSSLLPDLDPYNIWNVYNAVKDARVWSYKAKYDSAVLFKQKNRSNLIILDHIKSLAFAPSIEEFATILNEGVGFSNNTMVGSANDDKNGAIFKFENENTKHFHTLLGFIAGMSHNKPSWLSERFNMDGLSDGGASLLDDLNNSEGLTQLQCEKLIILLLGYHYTPLFDHFIANQSKDCEDQEYFININGKEEKDAILQMAQEHKRSTTVQHHTNNNNFLDLDNVNALVPIWNHGNVVFNLNTSNYHSSNNQKGETNGDNDGNVNNPIHSPILNSIANCFYYNNNRTKWILTTLILQYRRKDEGWSYYRTTNLPNRHSHCVDKKSFFALGYNSLDEMSRNVDNETFIEYLQLHSDCCGNYGLFGHNTSTTQSKIITNTTATTTHNTNPNSLSKKKRRIRHWEGMDWDQNPHRIYHREDDDV